MLRSWVLLANDGDDHHYNLTEYLPLLGGILFRETSVTENGPPAVALAYVPGLTLADLHALEDPAAAPGLRLARP